MTENVFVLKQAENLTAALMWNDYGRDLTGINETN